MKRSKTSKQWMKEHVNDAYVQRARSEGYRSRAAYKLVEIADQDKLLKPGMVVVDLGAAPGSWTQVAKKRVGAKGIVVAFDLLEIAPIAGVHIVRGNFLDAAGEAAVATALGNTKADLVLSDMSPNISGIGMSDQARAMELAGLALEFAVAHLKPAGALLVKVFQGAGFQEFLRLMRGTFEGVVVRKPAASRGRSSEIYLLGRGLVPVSRATLP